MTRDPGPAALRRCLLVWLTSSVGAALVAWACLPDLRSAWPVAATDAVAFDRLLVWLCEAVAVGCAAWLWAVTGILAGDAARGRCRDRAGAPAPLRRLVLAACGVALVGGLATPAQADPGGDAASVQGLPLPDRATAAMHVSLLVARQAPRTVVVREGDTLWGLARADLTRDATDDEITARWHEIYRANRSVIGPDPDLIRPEQRLRIPPR